MPSRRNVLKTGLGAMLSLSMSARADDPKPGSRLFFQASELKVGGQALSGIFVVDTDTSAWGSFLSFKTPAEKGSFSPDGRELAYGRFGERPNTFGKDAGIWICDAQTGEGSRKVVGVPVGSLFWTPDSKSLIVSEAMRIQAKPMHADSFRIRADGTGREAIKIPQDQEIAACSPANDLFVTTNYKKGGDNHFHHDKFLLVRPDGSEIRKLLDGEPLAGQQRRVMRFTPDGKSLLCQSVDDQKFSLWTMDLVGKNERRIVSETKIGAPVDLCWSPDGKRIAVLLDNAAGMRRGMGRAIEIADADGSNPRPLAIPDGVFVNLIGWR